MKRPDSYFVTVTVSDGEFTDELDVTVSVTNEDEAGSLTLSSVQPQVDTALTATLTDPDGLVSTDWVWERSQDNEADLGARQGDARRQLYAGD